MPCQGIGTKEMSTRQTAGTRRQMDCIVLRITRRRMSRAAGEGQNHTNYPDVASLHLLSDDAGQGRREGLDEGRCEREDAGR